MQTTKRLIAILMTILLTLPGALAQEPQRNKSGQAVSPDVEIILQQRQVRFTAQQAIAEMRLQIFEQSGELVYDSQVLPVNQLTWSWLSADGRPVKSGLYAYTLSIKEVGAEAARVRRGHLIVDRAGERDKETDRLWITSQDDTGIGTDLTVAKHDDVLIAGTRAPGERSSLGGRDTPRTVEQNEKSAKSSGEAVAAALAGTVGRIAKFTSVNDLGDSVITEQNSRIGIGTTSPLARLQVASAGESATAYTARFQSSPSVAGAGGILFDQSSTYGWKVHTEGTALTSETLNFNYVNISDGASLTANPLVLTGSGRVGIGTNNPASLLELAGFAPFITLRDVRSNGARHAYIQNAEGNIVFKANGDDAHVVIAPGGNVGIGTSQPAAKLHVAGNYLRVNGAGNEQTYIGGDGVGNDAQLGSANPNVSDVVLWNSATNKHMKLVASALVLAGGADFAENFDVNAAPPNSKDVRGVAPQVAPGMVVTIDPAKAGKLQLSTQAYDRRVAGIISGAGGVKPGMTMGQAGTLADGQHPVALSGRVYCWVDAARGAIEPGDLLTTSPTPGHAMKASNPARAQGAIIGKAMTGLKQGKGLVLVLVTLQ
jgi:hypothetical protein